MIPIAALPMTLGAGFTAGAISSAGYRLLFGGKPIKLSDIGFENVRPIAAGSGIVCDLAYDQARQVVYFREAGIRSVSLKDGTFDSIAEGSFSWLLAISPDSTHLVAWDAAGRPGRLTRIDLGTRAKRSVAIDGFAGGICASFTPERLCLPSHLGGPKLFDFSGREIASLPVGSVKLLEGRENVVPAFSNAAFGPDGAIALGGYAGGLCLWRPSAGSHELHDPLGSNVAWSQDGSRLWYLHGEDELWSLELGKGTPELVVKIEGNEATSMLETQGSYASVPIPSPDGRYLFVQLARWIRTDGGKRPFRPDLAALILDLLQKTVHQVPGKHFHDVAWVDIGTDEVHASLGADSR